MTTWLVRMYPIIVLFDLVLYLLFVISDTFLISISYIFILAISLAFWYRWNKRGSVSPWVYLLYFCFCFYFVHFKVTLNAPSLHSIGMHLSSIVSFATSGFNWIAECVPNLRFFSTDANCPTINSVCFSKLIETMALTVRLHSAPQFDYRFPNDMCTIEKSKKKKKKWKKKK